MKNTAPCRHLIFLFLFSAFTCHADVKDSKDHLDSKLEAKLVFYPNMPGGSVVPDVFIEGAHLTTEVIYEWATWFETGGDIRIDTTGWFEFGLPNDYRWRGGVRLFQDSAVLSRPVVLNELYATKPIGNLDLIVGRAIQRNSLSVLYPLADRYIARDMNDPINPKILGVWQARADYYAQDWQFSFAALPVFQPPKVPGVESRWFFRAVEPITGTPIPPGADGFVERDIPGVSVENTGLLATIKTHQQQWDAFSTVYTGYGQYSVTRTVTPSPSEYIFIQEYIPGFEWSSGISTVIDAVELHSEALYHHSYSGKDDDYIDALAGLTWRTDLLADLFQCHQVHLIAEYAREHILSRQDASLGYASSSEPFRIGKDTLFTECLLELTSRNYATVGYAHNFSENNDFAQLLGGHRFGNGMSLELGMDIFTGSGLYFGTWNNNDRLYLNYQYNF